MKQGREEEEYELVPEGFGVGEEAVAGAVAVKAVRCEVIVGKLIHPIFDGGERLTDGQISLSETVRERCWSMTGDLVQR